MYGCFEKNECNYCICKLCYFIKNESFIYLQKAREKYKLSFNKISWKIKIICYTNKKEKVFDAIQFIKINKKEKEEDIKDDEFEDKLEKEINKFKNNIIDKDIVLTEKEKLYNLLDKELKLIEYYNIFINNDINDLDTFFYLSKDDLDQIGITNINHQQKILDCITKHCT